LHFYHINTFIIILFLSFSLFASSNGETVIIENSHIDSLKTTSNESNILEATNLQTKENNQIAKDKYRDSVNIEKNNKNNRHIIGIMISFTSAIIFIISFWYFASRT
jgi:hypothetical protein